MGITRTFEVFRPPRRHDGIPFVTVTIDESATVDGTYTTIDSLALTPQDADPAHPQSRDLTTSNATLDPAWYRLTWVDSVSSYFTSDPISTVERSFVTVDELGDLLGRDLTDDEGAQDAVESASDMVRTFTEQGLTFTTETITLDGSGTDALLLPQVPVGTITAVSVAGTAVDAADYKLNGNGVLFKAGTTTGWQSAAGSWPAGRQNIEVTYSHGYSPDDVPRDLKAVARQIAARLFVQGVAQSESVGGDTITYGMASTDLTNGEKAILRKYKVAR